MFFKSVKVLFLTSLFCLLTTNAPNEYHLSDMAPTSTVCNELGERAIVTCRNPEQESSSDVISFHFTSIEKIRDVIATGSANLAYFDIKNDSRIEVFIKPTKNESSINLTFVAESNNEATYNLYFSKKDDGTCYTTDLSLDVAKRYASKELNYNIVSLDVETNDFESPKISPTAIGVVGSVSGTLKWTDDSGNKHPLVGAKVTVTISGSWWSETTYTNSTGYYYISYNDIWYIGSGKPMVHIYTDSESVCVSHNGIYEKTHEFNGSSGNFSYSYTFDPLYDGDMGKSVNILQAGINYANYAEYLNGGTPITKCTFNFPASINGGCYYDGANNVYITSSDGKTGFPTSYSSWDVIGHEYGHHVQKCFGIAANPGGKHYVNQNIIDNIYDLRNNDGSRMYTLNESKDIGLRLAWGEGWPTFWATIAQSTFPNDVRSIVTVGDLRYSSYLGFYYDIDTYDATTNGTIIGTKYRGDADEVAITSILYKLYSPTKDDYDSFSISDEELWTITISSKPHYFSQFIQALYDRGYNRHDLGRLLSKYAVAVGEITVSNDALDDYPTFSWSSYMGSNYLYYNNFNLVFTDASGKEILRKNGISSVGNKCQYVLTGDEWANIIASSGNKYYAYVIARQTDNYTSGNYYSEYFEFEKPTKNSKNISLNNIRYFENSFVIAPNSAWYFTINFAQSGDKLIQTFGTADTKMWLYESDGVTEIYSDDDSGYRFNSLIYKRLDANKNYILKVGLYSSNSSRHVKLAIAPIFGAQNSGVETIKQYEDFVNINTYHNFSWGAYLISNHVSAVTWTPPVSGNYEIDLTSEFDNFLYVINPQKTNSLLLDVDYNDDYYEYDARLSGYYESSITYFIIYSQFSPSNAFTDLNSGDDISLKITYLS